jgi:Mce-associated membrane protein
MPTTRPLAEVAAEALPETNAEDGDSPTDTAPEPENDAAPESPIVERVPSRLGPGWLIGITAAILVPAGGVGAGGHFALCSLVEETQIAPTVDAVSDSTPASWPARGGAIAVDVLPGVGVVATAALAVLTVPERGLWWWVCVLVGGLVILLMAINRLVLPTIMGWSLGRALFGITVVHRNGAVLGPCRLLLRDLAHLLDTASVFVGWLWPLWDSRRRTFADLLLRTEARRAEPQRRPRDLRRLTAVLVLVGALLCVGGAAVSYIVVYQCDRAIDQTRAEVAVRGSKIVEQMLTYDPKTLKDDFAHAQSLATDKYREQLVTQQQAVQKAAPVANEYWVTNNAVLSATPDRATMLLFMQGQRGAADKQRLITATVRATFAKSADGQWRVDDLTVVTKPQPAEDGT